MSAVPTYSLGGPAGLPARDSLRSRKDVEGIPSMRSWCQKLVKLPAFECFFVWLTLVNAISIGAEVEHTTPGEPNNPPVVYKILTHTFGFCFLGELIVRVSAEGRRFFFRSAQLGWNMFDTFLVCLFFVELAVEVTRVFERHETDATKGLQNTRLVRLVRILRLFKLLRVARLVHFVRALSVLIFSIVSCLRSLVWVLVLLLWILYFFSVLIYDAVSHKIADERESTGGEDTPLIRDLEGYYGSVLKSMLTLFASLSGGIDWSQPALLLNEISILWLVVFMIFICFAYFAVLNVVTGVFCHGAIESAQKDRELMIASLMEDKQMYVDIMNEQFKTMYAEIDKDASGSISIQEFEAHLGDPTVKDYFALLELDTTDAWTLFKLLDIDESNHIDVEEFVEGCLRLKGNARSIDLAKLRYDQKIQMRHIYACLTFVQSKLLALCQHMECIHKSVRSATEVQMDTAPALLPAPVRPKGMVGFEQAT